jgi:hypothetical protein
MGWFHLVSWNVVCLPLQSGGLAIRNYGSLARSGCSGLARSMIYFGGEL